MVTLYIDCTNLNRSQTHCAFPFQDSRGEGGVAGVPVPHHQGALPAKVIAQGRQGDAQAARLGGTKRNHNVFTVETRYNLSI